MIILNSCSYRKMKKVTSKSNIVKKNHTIGVIPEGKKSSRVNKANSCIKISLQNTQQQSANLTIQPSLSKSNIQNYSQKMIGIQSQLNSGQLQNNTLNLIERPNNHRNTTNNHNPKSSIQTVPNKQNRGQLLQLKQTNNQLFKQNYELKKKCVELQQLSLRDKEKIKNLIIRINQVKNNKQMNSQAKTLQPSSSKFLNCLLNATESYSFLPRKSKLQTPYKNIQNAQCDRLDCIERKKYLQNELYRERLQRDNLELQRRQWQRNREILKFQYNELLDEIKTMRENEF